MEDLRQCQLSEQQRLVLSLLSEGSSVARIAWFCGWPISHVQLVIRQLEIELDTTQLVQAGALLDAAAWRKEVSPAAVQHETALRALIGARVVETVLDGDNCGLRFVLPNGKIVTGWISGNEHGDYAGHMALVHEDSEYVCWDEWSELVSGVDTALEGSGPSLSVVREVLVEVVSKASDLIRAIDRMRVGREPCRCR